MNFGKIVKSLKGLKISLMSPRDINDVHKIETLSFSNPWPKSLFLSELTNPFSCPYTVKIVHDKKEIIVGYVIFWAIAEEAHLLDIAVHPAWRRRGIGKRVINFVIETSKELGLKKIYLEVRESNKIARELYKSVGFEDIGIRRGYYSDNKEDAVLMALLLKDNRRVRGYIKGPIKCGGD